MSGAEIPRPQCAVCGGGHSVFCLEDPVEVAFVVVADGLCDLVDGFLASQQEPFGMFQPDLLHIRGIGHIGPAFDQPVEVVFLEMEFPHQILDGDVGVVSLDVPGHFVEQNPVHGFALLPGQGEFILGAHNPEDAQQQSFADVPGADVVLVEFFQKRRQTGFHLFFCAGAGAEMQELLDVLGFHQGGLEEGDDLLGGDIFIHDFGEHVVGDSQEEDGGGSVQKIILVKAVLVDEAQVAFGEHDILSKDALSEFPFCHIGQFNVGVGMGLGHFSGLE